MRGPRILTTERLTKIRENISKINAKRALPVEVFDTETVEK
jgi:hypothetical protein